MTAAPKQLALPKAIKLDPRRFERTYPVLCREVMRFRAQNQRLRRELATERRRP